MGRDIVDQNIHGHVGMEDMVLWENTIPGSWLTEEDAAYLKQLPERLPTVEWVWSEMDRVWRSFGMDNRKPLANQRVGEFYGSYAHL